MSTIKAQQDIRQQSKSPVSGAVAGKPTPPKAWTTGTNPITQKTSAQPSTNGLANGHIQPAQDRPTADKGASASPERHAHDRLLYLLSNLLGLDVTVNLRNGEKYTGVFAGTSAAGTEPRYHLKMVRKVATSQDSTPNGITPTSDSLTGDGDDFAMAFDVTDVADLAASKVDLSSRQTKTVNGSTFRTDVEISGGREQAERVLQRWEPGPDDEINTALGNDDSKTNGQWDQFAANERLYNVRSDYNEDLYTTTIDRSNPQYKARAEKAERLAREIERDGEKRRANAPIDSVLDEEDKYSGVRRDAPALGKSGPNAYVLPAKRPISSKPTVPGAPYDPAIISSQLSRADAASPAKETPNRQSTPLDVPSVSNAKEVTQKLSAPAFSKTTAGGAASSRTASTSEGVTNSSAAAENGANIIRGVADAFKQFKQSEILRWQQQQRQNQQQRARDAKQEKSVKLNDLKKFSQNFKLSSRVPEDLVPILAKSKEKQDEIKAKAETQAREKEDSRQQSIPSTSPVPQSETSNTNATQRGAQTNELGIDSAPLMGTRTRSQQTPRSQNGSLSATRGQNGFNQRGSIPFRSGGPGAIPLTSVPGPLPIPQPIPHAKTENVVSPTSSTLLRPNAKAFEFKPNPSANTFTPTSTGGERSPSKRPSIASPPPTSSVATPAADFFRPSSKRSKLADGDWENTLVNVFSTVKRLFDQSDEQKRAQFASNGGIPQGYRTGPVWDTLPANLEKSYVDMFAKTIQHPSSSPAHSSHGGSMPHQHQLPLHLQNGGPHLQQNGQFYRPPPHTHGFQQSDDPRAQFNSSASSLHPSPRMAQPGLAFNGQQGPQMTGYPYGAAANGMSPGMAMRTLPAGAQYMSPQGIPMNGHMMVQQQSSGPYVAHHGPQIPGYSSPGLSHAQPHFGGHPAQYGMAGSYSSSPRGHAMSHQGSQQGHGPQSMFMMPGQGQPMMLLPQHGGPGPMRYGQPPFPGQMPQNPYGMQHRAMSSGGYGQHLTPRQQHSVPHQAGNNAAAVNHPASTNGDDAR